MNLRRIEIFGIFQIILIAGISNGTEFPLRSELGTLARVDLLNALKIALMTAHPRPTKEEKAAALELAKFLNTSYANDYLEGFYSLHKYDQVNDLLSFLNAYVYNGDPRHPSWGAAEKIIEMLKTKTSIKRVEEIRARSKKPKKSSRSKVIDINVKNYDFVKLYKNPTIFQLKPFKPKLPIYYITKNTNRKLRIPRHAHQNKGGTSYLIDSNNLKFFSSSRRSVNSPSGFSKIEHKQIRGGARNKARMESIYRKLLAIAKIRDVFEGTTVHFGTERHPTHATKRLLTSNKSTRPWKNHRKRYARFPTKTIPLAEFKRIKGNSQDKSPSSRRVPDQFTKITEETIQKYKSEYGSEDDVQRSLDDSVRSRGLPNNPTPLRKGNDYSMIRVKRTVSKSSNRARKLNKYKNNWKYITSDKQPSGFPNSYTKSYSLKLRGRRIKKKMSHIRQKRMVSKKLTRDGSVEVRDLSKSNNLYVSSNKQARGTPGFYTESLVLRNRKWNYPKPNHKIKIRTGRVVYNYNRRVDPNRNNYRPEAVSTYQI